MLRKLLIKNYAIIEKIEIDFSKGLNIITGETGAGKSILLGALGLIMGKRADTKTLFNTGNKCIIEGTFLIPSHYESFFKENDIDFEAETHIRREITPSGKSRAFINDTPTTLAVLKRLTSALVDLHQQFDTLDIHHVSFQLNIVDALAEHKDAVQAYRSNFSIYKKDKKQLEKLIRQSNESAKEIDFLEFQLNEFNDAELIENEDEEAEKELKTLSHAEDIKRVLGATQQQLVESETAVVSQLKELAFELNNISKYSTKIDGLKIRFEGLVLELEDVAEEMENLADKTEFDPGKIQEIRDRLDLVYRLQNKHQVNSVTELLDLQNHITEKLDSFGDLSGQIAALEKKLATQKTKLHKVALKISKQRKKVLPSFEKNVKVILEKLSMPHAQLKVRVNTSEYLTINGLDQVEFLFAANKGGRPEAIKDVASGGELSRLTLCIKSLVAGALSLPTMIFDEIDSGVSGDVALKMGNILKTLAEGHQIITITHTPQIAVQADTHYFVYKNHAGKKTTTSVKLLSKTERVTEVATMLSGSPPSTNALENAKELLKA
jgi:DNA repair protein RecN (Recombination protein N)